MSNLYVEDSYIEDGYIIDGVEVFWPQSIIFIPKASLTIIQTTPTEILQLDLNAFHLKLRDLEDNSGGRVWTRTHDHNPTVTVGGVTLARVIEILEPYTITFEDGQYAVNLVGANSNVGDRINVNNVSVRSANSAGLQDLSTLLASAYGGKVVVDHVTGQSGTSTPVGTFSTPVDNVTDALVIATNQGLNELYFNRNMTINEDLSAGFRLVGGSPFFVLTANSIADLTGCALENLTIQGEMDGLNTIRGCNIRDVTNVSGFIEDCAFNATVHIKGDTSIMSCYTNYDGEGHPVISVETGNLNVLGHRGTLGIADITSGHHDIDVTGGRVLISDTCTGGELHITGEPYEIIDQSGDGCIVRLNTGSDKVTELYALQGLDINNPMTVTSLTRESGDINLAISGNGTTTSTVTRLPSIFTVADEFGNELADELANTVVG